MEFWFWFLLGWTILTLPLVLFGGILMVSFIRYAREKRALVNEPVIFQSNNFTDAEKINDGH